jgi:hypothetical protein
MLRNLLAALLLVPAVASAQPCTTDARRVVDELYRHMLERSADPASAGMVQRLTNGNVTVRELVRDIANSPEHTQRFYNSSENDAHLRAVETLYRHVLGRHADPEGAQANARLAQSRGLGAVVDRLVNSPEYQQSFNDWGVPGSGGLRYCGSNAPLQQTQRASEAVLFRQPGFQGRSLNLSRARPTLPVALSLARSIQVVGGAWELCEGTQFRGRCATVSSDVTDLRSIGVDGVGSIRPVAIAR